MFLKELILKVLLWEGVVVWKELVFNSFYLGGCGHFEIAYFNSSYIGRK